MYGFVYIWYDCKHKRYYVGRHRGIETDGYVCSSRWMRKSFIRRPEDFSRRILSRVDTKEELLFEEDRWLQLIKNEELGKRYYNLSKKSHWGVLEHSEENIERIKKGLPDRSGVAHPMFGKKHRPESIEKMRKPKTNDGIFSENLKKQWAEGKRKGHSNGGGQETRFVKGQVAHNKGVAMPNEQREKLKAAWVKRRERGQMGGRKKKELDMPLSA